MVSNKKHNAVIAERDALRAEYDRVLNDYATLASKYADISLDSQQKDSTLREALERARTLFDTLTEKFQGQFLALSEMVLLSRCLELNPTNERVLAELRLQLARMRNDVERELDGTKGSGLIGDDGLELAFDEDEVTVPRAQGV